MFTCDRFSFASPPKTGCRWMHSLMNWLEGGEDVSQPNQSIHHPADGWPGFMLTHVRHPADWLRSYAMNITSPVMVPDVDRFLGYGDPIERREHIQQRIGTPSFIEAYLDGPSGTIGAMFNAYAGLKMRLEDQPETLESWLGVAIPERDKRPTTWTMPMSDDLRAAIVEHERDYCLEFGYL